MHKLGRKLCSALLCLALLAGMLPAGVMPAWAKDGELEVTVNDGNTVEQAYTYNSENHTLTVHNGANITVSGTTTTDHIVVEGNATITLSGVDIQFSDGDADYSSAGETNAGTCALWIGDGAEVTLTLTGNNTLKSGAGRAGINVASTASLTINGKGTLNVTGGNCAAGIGGGLWNNAGDITIESGTINATGGSDGAGIGGGHANDALKHQYGGFESITINGGNVTATSAGNGAGIGTGCWSMQTGRVSIQNATVNASTASTRTDCSAIGWGTHSNGAGVVSISIQNSTFSAITNGGAQMSGGEDVTITNSLVAQGVGSINKYEVYGNYTLSDNRSVDENQSLFIYSDCTLNLGGYTLSNNGTIFNYGTVTGPGTIDNSGTFYNAGTIPENIVSGEKVISIVGGSYPYLDASGTEQNSPENTQIVTADTTSLGISGNAEEQWYIVLGDVSFNSNLAVNGDVHLILADGSSLTANGGIRVSSNNSLTIYGQTQGTGQLTANGGKSNCAGIGGA